MREEEVKKKIGKKNWGKFLKWMCGQTCSMYKDGSTNFYDCDVEAFVRKLETGYDRQNDPAAWD